MILKDIIPEKWRNGFAKLSDDLNEIRLRALAPVKVVCSGKHGYLTESGFSAAAQNAFMAQVKDINDALFLACEKSVYAFNDNIINGFLTLSDGCRIGVCGRVVKENGRVIAIRDVSSLNVRVPRAVRGCADKIFGEIYPVLKNLLVIAPPGAGKTTFLRETLRLFDGKKVNILVADERNELACIRDGKPFFDLGGSVDVLSNSDKAFAFECGLRTMTPDIIVCDELFGNDAEYIEGCIAGGVKMIASVHAESVAGAQKRLGRKVMECFDKFVVLSRKNRPGEIIGTYGKEALI